MAAIRAAGTPCPVTSATQNAEALFVDEKKIVEVTCDGAHRNVARGEIETGKSGHRLRKNGSLNSAGYFQFFMDGEKAFFGREDTIPGDVSEAGDKA